MNDRPPTGGIPPRDELPWLLWGDWMHRRIDPGDLPARLEDAWTLAAFPSRALLRVEWVKMFSEAGFISDTGRPKPTELMEIWRAQVGHIYGMSWTSSEDVARWFHRRNLLISAMAPRMRLYRGLVEPVGVLAMFEGSRDGSSNRDDDDPPHPLHSGEHEVVIDPRYLRRPVERVE